MCARSMCWEGPAGKVEDKNSVSPEQKPFEKGNSNRDHSQESRSWVSLKIATGSAVSDGVTVRHVTQRSVAMVVPSSGNCVQREGRPSN